MRKFLCSWFFLVVWSLCLTTQAQPSESSRPVVKMDIRIGEGASSEKQSLMIELNADEAPKTVQNFLSYVDAKFYDHTIFHRLIPGFMIQGGGFTKELSQKPTQGPIINEAKASMKNVHGTIAMARTMDVNSATSQFYINFVDNAFLDHQDETDQGYGYAVFGRVISGLDWLNHLQTQETHAQNGFTDVPTNPILIEKISRVP